MQTYVNRISLNYNKGSISLPVIHNGIDLQWIPELKDYLQDIFDDLPQYFRQAYHPVSLQVLMNHDCYTTHVITFNLRDSYEPDLLSGAITDKIIELLYDPEFSGPILPQIMQTHNSVTIINYGG